MGQSDIRRVRVAGRKEEERILKCEEEGDVTQCAVAMMEAVTGWREDDDQQVVPLKNVIPLFLLPRARTSWFPRSVVVVTIP